MSKKIKVGFDFDGVIAYNPFRIIRYPISFLKRNILGIKRLSFWYPQTKWQQIFWKVCHESSVFPARGIEDFKALVKQGEIEAHLVTARYSFLDDHLYHWLERHNVRKLFTTVNMNLKNEQPHLFKEKFIKQNNLEFFIEDNLDIVKYLAPRVQTKVFWIYNILDRNYPYRYKYPYLGKALSDIPVHIHVKANRSVSVVVPAVNK